MLSEEKTQNTLEVISGVNNTQELVFTFNEDPEDILDIFEATATSL